MSKHLPYNRADRLATELHHIIASAIHDLLTDPRLEGVQITQVRVTKDLRLARVNYFLRGDPVTREACQKALEGATHRLRRVINDALSLRFLPELLFHFDEAIEQGERIDDLLRTLEAGEQKELE